MKTVLIIDKHDDDRRTMEALLRTRYHVMSSPTIIQASRIAREHPPAAIVLDLESSHIDGHHDPQGAAALIAPQAGVVCAVGALGDGHDPPIDCLTIKKPYSAEALYAVLRQAACAAAANILEWPSGRKNAPKTRNPFDHQLIGECEALRAVAERIQLYAPYDAPVLIVGESGTGKELAASAIHRASKRSSQAFLPVDCAAISGPLVESVLFGTIKGAFTDAIEKKGAFETARGGTVFLDEIAEMTPAVQAKLLRTLETGRGHRVGAVEDIQYDVRVLSATNAELYGGKNRFRPELLHRIDTLVLEMPSLRDHKDDIPALASSFLSTFSPGKTLSSGAIAKLRQWDWPGNVRELRNVVNRAGGTVR